jgi:hypothetical protein
MLDQKSLNRILFLDIETTSQKENFSDLTEHQQEIFQKRFKKDIATEFSLKFPIRMNEEIVKESKVEPIADAVPETSKKKSHKKKPKSLSEEEVKKEVTDKICGDLYNQRAPIFPEFGRILCISVGAMWKGAEEDNFYIIKIITFSNEDEKTLLTDFIKTLGPVIDKVAGKYEKNQSDFWAICAHNGRVFDFPFIAKRMIIHGLKLPAMFDYAHLKPWEQTHIIDTKETWSFGIWDAAVSLDCLSDIFGTASSKDDIDGSQVKDIFWKEKDLPRIAKYCEKDVIALATNYLRMKSMTEEIRIFESPKVDVPIAKQEEIPIQENQEAINNSEEKPESGN